jgi:AcrR family transcriptional regulator
MSMSSLASTPARRVPRQERGERRVVQLLETAALLFAEKGYEAATMTEIAERSGASIGAVYQYFPNKEAVVRALRAQYGNEMEKRWALLEEVPANVPIAELVGRLVDVMACFMEEHPAYIPLLDAPLSFRRDQQARVRLRERFAKLFSSRTSRLSPEQAFRVANVALQIVKSMNLLYAEARPKERVELVREYKSALTAYLEERLTR